MKRKMKKLTAVGELRLHTMVALSTSYLGSPIFTSARQVLDELDLTQIVRLVQEYQRRFEEVAR